MPKYKVFIEMIYSDVVHVEADSKKEAVTIAMQECSEEFESVYCAEVVEDDES